MGTAIAMLAAPRSASAHGAGLAVVTIEEEGALTGGTTVRVRSHVSGGEGRSRGLHVRLPPRCETTSRREAVHTDALETVLEARCAAPLAGATVEVSGLEGQGLEVLLSVRDRSGHETRAVLRDGEREVLVGTRPSRWQLAKRFVSLGATHVTSGLDHVAFVAALAGLARGTWAAVRAVTGFTLGHALTLAAVTLGGVVAPARAVELCIALSVLAAAVGLAAPHPPSEPVEPPRPSPLVRMPFAAALAVGLLHGLGLASTLRDAGLPESDLPLALTTFHVGVEAAQLGVLLGTLAVLALANTHRARLVLAYVTGGAAAHWALARAAALLG